MGNPQIYWFAAPLHRNWSDDKYQIRIKFNNCQESVAAVYGNWMRIIKLKEFWSVEDDRLLVNNMFTSAGLAAYWRAINAAFKCNHVKKLEFETREAYRKLVKTRRHEDNTAREVHVNEDMQQFF